MLRLTIVFYNFVDFKVIYNLGSKWVEKFGRYFFVCSDLGRYFRVSFQTV